MAFPFEYLELDDIGREVCVMLHGGVPLQTTLTGIHAVTTADGELEVSIDTPEPWGKDLLLAPGSFIHYADGQ